jgi:hydroxyethylthiazole kinase-like uncharacterized protein yjeF
MSTERTLTPALLREWTLPEPGGSKNTRGRLLVIGGAVSTPGAALLAGIAALRVGAGVLSLVVPEPVAIPLAVEIPEASVTTWTARSAAKDVGERLESVNAVVVGPGVDTPDDALALVRAIAGAKGDLPVVLDAFALGALPDLDDEDAEALAGRIVLTPNQGEAERLLDTEIDESPDDDESVDIARRVAKRWQAVVSFQGAVATPDGSTYYPSTGAPGLGTSGSGDVLAGAACGLLARGAGLDQAACWATFLHGAAGDRLAARVGRLGFLARELLDELPLVLDELSH